MERSFEQYFRQNHLPHLWCPGCGNGIAMKAIVQAVEKKGWSQDNTVIVSGIGCSSRASGYMDFDTLHTAHGRAIPFATGIKLANPDLNVIVITGDGDCTAIGGNHFIHGCRRNVDLTVIMFNNNIYGMTGGQASPTTPVGAKATTAPYGSVDRTFDACKLAEAAGATYVARSTAFHVQHMTNMIADGLDNKGFSFIEAMVQCPTAFGRKNRMGSPADMLKWMRDHAVMKAAWDKLPEEKREDKFPIGCLYSSQAIDYDAAYDQVIRPVAVIRPGGARRRVEIRGHHRRCAHLPSARTRAGPRAGHDAESGRQVLEGPQSRGAPGPR